MVFKEDVVSWFNDLESYKRIDTMCTLLNMCLPFELRFLGTCIEDLGRRDFQLLRGVSDSVNTAKELTAIYDSCLSGGPSDQRIRRKLALYVALLRFGKVECVNDLFRVLASWDYNELLAVPSGLPLEEILLLYTLAHWHPVFNFDQRTHCGNISKRLQEDRANPNLGPPAQGNFQNISRQMAQNSSNLQNELNHPNAPMTNASPMTNRTSVSPALQPLPMQNIPMQQTGEMSPISHVQPLLNNMPPSLSNISNTPQLMHSPAMTSVPPPPMQLVQLGIQMSDFTVPYGPWSRTPVMQPMGPPPSLEQVLEFSQKPYHVSSQSASPCQSRAASPTYNSNRPRPPMAPCRSQRRPPNDVTPPPPSLYLQQETMKEKMKENTLNSSQKQLGNFTLHEVAHMDEEKLLKIGMTAGAMNQLRNIVNCNGYCIPNVNLANQNQQNMNSQISMNRSKHSFHPAAYCATQLETLRLDAENSLHQSSASESGSSGSAGHSPPDTPAPSYPNRTKDRRMNGRPDKYRSTHNESYVSSTSSGSNNIPTVTTTPQFAYNLQHHQYTSPRVLTHFSPSYRPQQISFQPNGDIVYPYPPPFLHQIPTYSNTPAPNNRSCYNCGGMGHSGNECKEQTMEEIARPGHYQLDYSTTASSDISTEK